MDIIQSFYYANSNIRQSELEKAVLQNLLNPFINKLHIFIENKDKIVFLNSSIYRDHNSKICLVDYESQPTYKELFSYCNNLDNKICCICNTDIEIGFNYDMKFIIDHLINKNVIYFLTRHEYDMSLPLIKNFRGSHDAFIFHSNTLKNSMMNIDIDYINYIQNTPGIESLLTIFFIETLKYNIYNPCIQLKIIHHHKSNQRVWQNNGNKLVGYTSPKKKTNHASNCVHCSYIIKPITMKLES